MNIFALLSLVSAGILFSLGIFVYSRNPRSALHQVFLLLVITASWWSFTEFMLRYSVSYQDAYFWMRMTAFWTLVPAFTLNFIWLFTTGDPGRPRSTWIYPFMFLPAAVFCALELFTGYINTGPVLQYWGYTYGIADNPMIYIIELAWAFGLMILSLASCLAEFRGTRDPGKRKQAQYIATGIGIPIVSALVSIVLLPSLGIAFPEVTPTFFLLFSGFVGYAIWKYDLFVLSPETAAETIISTMTDLLVLLDPDGKIVTVNNAAAEKLGYPAGEISGKQVEAIFGETGRPGILEEIRLKSSLSDEETVCRKKDGTPVPVSLSGSVIRDTAGSISGIVLVLRDITRRKAAEDELKQVLGKLNLLSEITRHDLVNQITALHAWLELAKDRGGDPEVSGFLEQAEKVAGVIAEQVSFMKDYENMGTTAPVWQDARAVISQSTESLPVRNVRVSIGFDTLEVLADPLLPKVFYNLVDNALRHGGGNLSLIRFSAEESGDGLHLACEDNGAGIPPEEEEQLFTKGFGRHTGLGLFLAREILAITGIRITGTGTPGKGARFDMIVPAGAYRFMQNAAVPGPPGCREDPGAGP